MKTYEMPELEIEVFEVEDIITTSSNNSNMGDNPTDVI